jgi:hypothetical protein
MNCKIRVFLGETELRLPENIEDIFNLGKHHPEIQVTSDKYLDVGRHVNINNIIYVVSNVVPMILKNSKHVELKILLEVYQNS